MTSPTWGDMSTGTGQGGLAPAPLNAPSSPGVQVGIQPGASTGIFIGHLVIVGGSGSAVSGIFVYSGTPAHGNPPILSITNSTTDPFGNTVTPSLTLSGLPFLVYSSAPASGNLFLSAAEINGTDEFGNTYQTGYQVHGTSGSNIEITTLGGIPFAFFTTGVTEESTSADISATIVNPGVSEVIQMSMVGARVTGSPTFVDLLLLGAAKDGSSLAEAVGQYIDTSSVTHDLLIWGANGVQVTSLFSGDSNTYQPERLTVVLASDVVINTLPFAQVIFAAFLGVGTYIIEGILKIFPTAAAGTPSFEFTGGAAVATMNVEFWELKEGNPGTLGNVGAVNAFGAAYTASVMAGGGRAVYFNGLMIVTTAGVLNMAAATSVAADTYTIVHTGSYMNVMPVGS